MATYVLKLKSKAGSTLTLKGPVKNTGRYFGGADMEDMWLANSAKTAYQYTNKKEAAADAKRFGCGESREFIVEEL